MALRRLSTLPSVVVAAAFLLALLSCRGEEPTPGAGGTSDRGGTVVLGIGTDIDGVNELTAPTNATQSHILYQLFLHLLEEQPDFYDHPPTFAPDLAESYEWSEDHTTVTLHLRDDAFWTDGTPVTAEDVRFSWQAQVHPDVAWESAYMKEAISDVEVVDPHTVRFHFTHVYPAQLVHLNEGAILPKHVWGRLPFSEWRSNGPWFADNLVTAGPFRLESWSREREIVLARNESYYREGLPRLDRVVFRVVPDQASQVAELLAGSLDFIPSLSPDDVGRIRSDPRLDIAEYWGIGVIFINWNNESPLFSDRRVRQALTLAIDRQGIVDGLWGEYGEMAASPIVSTVWAHNRDLEPWPHDPQRARELLAEAGWADTDGDGILDKDGRAFRFEILTHTGNQQREDAAVIAQQELRGVGIDAQPRLTDFGSFVGALTQGDFEASVAGMNIGTDVDLHFLLHSDQIDSGLNHARYRSAEVDRLIDLASSQPELADMAPYLKQIQEIVHQDQPMTFLWYSKRLVAYNRRLQGVQSNVLTPYFNLPEWRIEPQP